MGGGWVPGRSVGHAAAGSGGGPRLESGGSGPVRDVSDATAKTGEGEPLTA
jgi:hypothetical protein